MTKPILLLDCNSSLRSRLEAQGYTVVSGTSGYCTGIRTLPCQIYEVGVVIYNPTTSFRDPTPMSKVARYSAGTETETPECDFDEGTLLDHLHNGAHWLAFLNRVSDDSNQLNWTYSWIPEMPQVLPTLDQQLAVPNDWDSKKYMVPFLPLVQSHETLGIVRPVKQKMREPVNPIPVGGSASPGFEPLLMNARGEPLAAVVHSMFGNLTVLPQCQNNDDVAVFYIDRVLPNLKPTSSRREIPDEFVSPDEAALLEEEQKILNEYEALGNRHQLIQKQLENARGERRRKIKSDETSQRIMGYYRDAEIDPKSAPTHLYKVREAVARCFSSHDEAKISLVDCNEEWNYLGKMTNVPSKDARHAPKPGEIVAAMTADELRQCYSAARKIILAYFRTLF